MDIITWNKIVTSFENSHFMQSWQWGETKERNGWKPFYKIWGDEESPSAAALILQRTITFLGGLIKLRIQYSPKGPLIRDLADEGIVSIVFDELRMFARDQRAIFLKADPDIVIGVGVPGEEDFSNNDICPRIQNLLGTGGWVYSPDQIQFRNTVLVNLSQSEDSLLSNMKQKTRYNIRLSERKGVIIRDGTREDFNLLYRMYAETSMRDGFAIREIGYYQTLWEIFSRDWNPHGNPNNRSGLDVLIAEVEGIPTAAVVIIYFAGVAYYYNGMSLPIHRKLMPNYLLQWEAIKRAKNAGCKLYDLWGAPEIFNQRDTLWGVYRFKRGFGGYVQRSVGAYDYPVNAFIYNAYINILPKLLEISRMIGSKNTKKLMET